MPCTVGKCHSGQEELIWLRPRSHTGEQDSRSVCWPHTQGPIRITFPRG